jgi:hypothetical protein
MPRPLNREEPHVDANGQRDTLYDAGQPGQEILTVHDRNYARAISVRDLQGHAALITVVTTQGLFSNRPALSPATRWGAWPRRAGCTATAGLCPIVTDACELTSWPRRTTGRKRCPRHQGSSAHAPPTGDGRSAAPGRTSER